MLWDEVCWAPVKPMEGVWLWLPARLLAGAEAANWPRSDICSSALTAPR